MATPPNGSSADWPYGRGPAQGQGGQQGGPGDPSQNRFNFPSAPSRSQQYEQQGPPQYGQHGQHGRPGGPQQGQPQPGQRPYQQQPPHRGQQQPGIQPVGPRAAGNRGQAAGSSSAGAHNPLVRPYAMTGGRTRPRYQLAIEALVHTTAEPSRLQGQLPEHQRICHLCREIKSVAEISALLSIPLGVARILVADLAEAGLVAIHQPGGDEAAGGQPDVTLLERVLSGLRKL
ncbi:DUF742 domain-containing protein [Streptomyces sp. NPDC051561]|uniref:DUF742 domain-containing protein n=1 Tax=Streptomyces sp. NPDC051561 TaxID=3365658 RepID=UPI0037B15E99